MIMIMIMMMMMMMTTADDAGRRVQKGKKFGAKDKIIYDLLMDSNKDCATPIDATAATNTDVLSLNKGPWLDLDIDNLMLALRKTYNGNPS